MADPSQTQQVTSQTPATKQKNSKRVAAGKLIAERTRLAREAQKKALIEAHSMIAKGDPAPPVAEPQSAPPVAEPQSVITTTQWLSIASIIVSLWGIYYKREEIKRMFVKTAPQVDVAPQPPPAARKGGINLMD